MRGTVRSGYSALGMCRFDGDGLVRVNLALLVLVNCLLLLIGCGEQRERDAKDSEESMGTPNPTDGGEGDDEIRR